MVDRQEFVGLRSALVAEAAHVAEEARQARKRELEVDGPYVVFAEDRADVKRKKQNKISADASRVRHETYTKALEDLLKQAEGSNAQLSSQVRLLKDDLVALEHERDLLQIRLENSAERRSEGAAAYIDAMIDAVPDAFSQEAEAGPEPFRFEVDSGPSEEVNGMEEGVSPVEEPEEASNSSVDVMESAIGTESSAQCDFRASEGQEDVEQVDIREPPDLGASPPRSPESMSIPFAVNVLDWHDLHLPLPVGSLDGGLNFKTLAPVPVIGAETDSQENVQVTRAA